jgi:hypothetical protein
MVARNEAESEALLIREAVAHTYHSEPYWPSQKGTENKEK